ncbi:MAG: hypothetical protein FJY88_01265 [Candidatus Eisenbacteria bacterium]|nr:hypothetical protein [Candidatus Eisenbacteria bacterium]
MKCKTARSLFSLRLDDGLSYAEQRELAEHLDACPGCKAEFLGVERTVGLVRGLSEVQAPEGFVQDVLRAARGLRPTATARPAEPSLWERLRGFASALAFEPSPRLAAAALALGLIVGVSGSVFFFGDSPSPQVAQTTPATAPSAPLVDSGVETPGAEAPLPSGPFEDLVQVMMKRAESAAAGAADTAGPQLPEWGAGWDPSVHGQQVGFGPRSRRDRGGDGSGYIIF